MKVRYVLRVLNPKTKRWVISQKTRTLKGMGKRMAFNLMFNKDYYCDEDSGKRLKLRLTCEEKRGGKWVELEKYKITKDWKIYGYFEWEKIGA